MNAPVEEKPCEKVVNGGMECSKMYDCCDCGGNDCGCAYCFSCNACDTCKEGTS